MASWSLHRGYAALIQPGKGAQPPLQPETFPLKLESEFRAALVHATSAATGNPMTSVVFKMNDDRSHPVREAIMKLAFGQTRTPMAAMQELAGRLSQFTDHRTGSSLMITTLEENDDQRRVTMYVFPEEESYTFRKTDLDEAILERLRSFVLKSRLRKVARFAGKDIGTHFLQGEVADLQIGSGPRSAADYWVTSFLAAEFAINDEKGTRLVAAGLKKAFQAADQNAKERVMEAVAVLMADRRQAYSLKKVAKRLPPELSESFCSVARNQETLHGHFFLNKELLRSQINYRVFQLESGVWVSAPFQEVGTTVKLFDEGKSRRLMCQGIVVAEKVRNDKQRA